MRVEDASVRELRMRFFERGDGEKKRYILELGVEDGYFFEIWRA
jgi:hypothetical protein